jgi:hypothetical protein
MDRRRLRNDAAIGDADADGHLDIAISHAASGMKGVTVYFGVGDGTFARTTTLPLAGTPRCVAFGRFDATSAGLDLAAYHERIEFGSPTRRIAIWASDGAGGFEPRAAAIPQNTLTRLHAADLDDDGDDDLAGASAFVEVLRAQGGGAFLPARTHDAGAEPFAVVTGDVVTAAWMSSPRHRVRIYRGAGGRAGDTAAMRAVLTAPQPQAIAAADFDADGRNDLAL